MTFVTYANEGLHDYLAAIIHLDPFCPTSLAVNVDMRDDHVYL